MGFKNSTESSHADLAQPPSVTMAHISRAHLKARTLTRRDVVTDLQMLTRAHRKHTSVHFITRVHRVTSTVGPHTAPSGCHPSAVAAPTPTQLLNPVPPLCHLDTSDSHRHKW